MTNDEILALGTQPIPGDNPVGENPRYDDNFGVIEAEVSKLESPTGGEVDWKLVLANSCDILAGRAKDILLATYLARSLYQGQGMPGLAVGLTLCRDLLTTFPDALLPTRVKARRSALEWLSERLALVIGPDDIASPQGQEAFATCRTRIDEIWNWGQDHFEGEDCGLGALRRRMVELQGGATEGTSDTAAADAGSSQAAARPVAGGRAGPIATRADAIARLTEIAEFFSRTEPHSPIGFLVGRAVSWNQKSFQEVFQELLKGKTEAQDQLWDALGLPPRDGSSG